MQPEFPSENRISSWRVVVLRDGLLILSTIAAAIGAIWLIAWVFGIPPRWAATSVITVKTNMALGIVLSASSVLLLQPTHPSWQRRCSGIAIAVMVFLIGASTLYEHLSLHDLGIDQLLFAEPLGATGVVSPNRMGPPGALSLTIIGLGLLAVGFNRRRLAPYFGVLVCVVNLVPAVGYLFGATAFYGVPQYTGIAWSAIPALMAIGIALLLMSPETGPMVLLLRDDEGGRLLRRLLPATLLTPVLLGYLRTLGENAHLYATITGRALLVISITLVFSALLWTSATLLSKSSAGEKDAHRELQYLSAIVESSDDAIFAKSLDGEITSWNRGAEQLYGYTADEILGCSVNILIPPDRADELDKILNRIANGERINQYETVRRRRDGSQFEVAVKISPIMDSAGTIIGASSIAHDISERKRADQALRDSEVRFRAVAENVPQMIWVSDARANFSYLSPKWLSYTGTTLEENQQGNWIHVVHPEDRQKTIDIWRRAVATEGAYETEYRMRRHDGEYRWHLARAVPITNPNTYATAWFGTTTDIQDQKRANEALIRSEKLASVGRMAATVAHEINNPLAMIMNLLYITGLDNNLSQRARESLATASQELERVAHLTRQTLGFYRENTAPTNFDVTALVHDVVQLYAPKLMHREVAVEFQHHHELYIEAIPGEIRQVVSNIIANAIDASPDGGRMLIRTNRAIFENNSYVRLTFADTGEGIEPKNLKHIFDAFFTTKEAVGTGLGLWVSNEIVRRHGGKMRVRSRRGHGTVFSIFLPKREHPNEVASRGEDEQWQNAS